MCLGPEIAALTSFLSSNAAAISAGSAAVGAGTAIYGTVASGTAAREGAKAEGRIQAIKTARERRQAIREARIKQANIAQSAANQGVTSSAVEGGTASISSQLSSNLSFLDQIGGLNREVTRQGGRAATAGSIANLGGTIFDAAGGGGAFTDLFAQMNKKRNPARVPGETGEGTGGLY